MNTAVELDAGTYEVLRVRLAGHGAELARRAGSLNERRTAAPGTTLRGVGRLHTTVPRVPRDVVAVGDLLVFGAEEVLSAYTRDLAPAEAAWLADERYRHDLAELRRYYRDTRLLQLRRHGDRLLAVFQTGPRTDDVRVLRWQVAPDGAVSYLDNLGERDHELPPPHDIDWIRTTRADHGPEAVTVDGAVRVASTGGRLTIATPDRGVVHTEPVEDALQSLADADIAYARVGPLVLLKVRPYRESGWRYLVHHTATGDVARLDRIGQACRVLPEAAGIVFPGGCYLATSGARTFDTDVTDLEFERVFVADGGEHVLYAFRARAEGRTLLLAYNVIRGELAAPVTGNGYALFDDGTLVVLRPHAGEPAKVHQVQVWNTPFTADPEPLSGAGPLARFGDADLIRAVADCLAVHRMIEDLSPSAAVFDGVIAAANRVLDRHHWLAEAEVGDLRTPLLAVRDTASRVLVEYARVREATATATATLDAAAERVSALIGRARGEVPTTTSGWIRQLAALRQAQGELVGLRDLRQVDTGRLDDLVAATAAELAAAGARAATFLAGDTAFAAYDAEIDQLAAAVAAVDTVAPATELADRIAAEVADLRATVEVIGGLEIADTGQRSAILDRVGAALAGFNRVRAILDLRLRELRAVEGRAAFGAEHAVLRQSVGAALAIAGTPAQCDAELARLLLTLDDLETRFDDQIDVLGAERVEVTEAFTARKQALLDERARRVRRLLDSAERMLATLGRRLAALPTPDEVTSFVATDPLAAKLRGIVDELRRLDEPVAAEELAGRQLATVQDAGRALRDRRDLYSDGGATIRLGRHTFAVTTEPVELTVLPHGDALAFAVTGTDYRMPVTDPAFAATRRFWDRPVVSESPEVYRGEYLAATLLTSHGPVPGDVSDLVRRAAEARYDEGYTRGVHDHDAALILTALSTLYRDAGLLRYPPADRAAAQLFWAHGRPDPAWARRAASLARAREVFAEAGPLAELAAGLHDLAGDYLREVGLPNGGDLVGEYLVEELAQGGRFVAGVAARSLVADFQRALGDDRAGFEADLAALDGDLAARYQLAHGWLGAFAGDHPDLPEALALLLCPVPRRVNPAPVSSTVDGLLGVHPRVTATRLAVRLDELLARVRAFEADEVPAHRAYQRERAAVVARERERLRLDDHKPRVMAGFVRNRLIDEVYLPLVGDNLARQLGTPGSGLLLLISPPGYGKTTLVEYVASRLGMLLVTVAGPALGSGVTSLDPARAPDAGARHEVEKINFALELGTNVMLYVDDIQHVSPELLQRFVPLCDTQRRLGGHDLRGKRFAVCLAGNPYTGSGERFHVPDMLANRADVWNLGEVVSGREELFALSFLENAVAANPGLDPGDRNLLHARDVVMAVNRAYIASAGQDAATRTGVPFRLQGSYRDMNAIARRILPVMDEAELAAVIDDHYRAQARTLGPAAEANLAMFADIHRR